MSAQSRKLKLIYFARFVRALCFSSVSVVFALFLLSRDFSALEIGMIVSATLIEDAVLTALVSVLSHRIGLRNLLLIASLILSASGAVFAFATERWAILLAAVFGIISPSGYEGGPFGAVEQAVISENAEPKKLAHEFSIYNLIAFGGSAIGSFLAGFAYPLLSKQHSAAFAYQSVFIAYALGGILLLLLYWILGTLRAHSSEPGKKGSGAIKSPLVWKLISLQGLDAFGGGFIPMTLISFWFFERYHVGPEFSGQVFAATYALAAVSFLISPYVCRRFGLLNTMVFTHLPCSMALCLIPLMPTAFSAGMILVLRSLFSSMDIPARQAFSMVLVSKEDRTAVAGMTAAARSFGQCAAPLVSGWFLSNACASLSFQIAGGLKTFYDVAIFASFRNVPLHSESEKVD